MVAPTLKQQQEIEREYLDKITMEDTNLQTGFIAQETERGLPIVIFSGDSISYTTFIKGQGDKARLTSVDGHARWIIVREDGSEYILRPQEAVCEHELYTTDGFDGEGKSVKVTACRNCPRRIIIK